MSAKPRIAVIMDENTSIDGTHYDMPKAYFTAIHRAGGIPFGIPYIQELVEQVIEEFDGFLSVGGRFAFPDAWYVDGQVSKSPPSDRLEVEVALMRGFLERDKPVLGICNGMQILACLHGCRMSPDLQSIGSHILEHDKRGHLHPASIRQDTALARIVGEQAIMVNTFHREAVVEMSDQAVASAHAEDGTIEAIEIPARRFALGVQWHPEQLALQDRPANRLFEAFVRAAGQR